MKSFFSVRCLAPLLAGAASLAAAALLAGCGKAPPPAPARPASAVAKTNAAPVVAATNDTAQFVSVFEDLPPQKGKDPFFPNSRRREPMTPAAAAKANVTPVLILKGIVGSVGRRIAVINNETMQVGEESPVRIPGGHAKVKCLEIGVDYAIVQVEGEPQPKKLVMEQKK